MTNEEQEKKWAFDLFTCYVVEKLKWLPVKPEHIRRDAFASLTEGKINIDEIRKDVARRLKEDGTFYSQKNNRK